MPPRELEGPCVFIDYMKFVREATSVFYLRAVWKRFLLGGLLGHSLFHVTSALMAWQTPPFLRCVAFFSGVPVGGLISLPS